MVTEDIMIFLFKRA